MKDNFFHYKKRCSLWIILKPQHYSSVRSKSPFLQTTILLKINGIFEEQLCLQALRNTIYVVFIHIVICMTITLTIRKKKQPVSEEPPTSSLKTSSVYGSPTRRWLKITTLSHFVRDSSVPSDHKRRGLHCQLLDSLSFI